jgi:CheY-like chemotaxis protein
MTKIMLVEDDNNLREIYEARLLAEGYEIVSAKDGEEALAIAVKEKPDLIISDVMMPKISGFDMLDILRSTPETRDTKVIMMTALSQAEDKTRADKLGADKYLVKSQVTLEDVARVAAEVLSGKTETPEAPTPEPVASFPTLDPTPAPEPTPDSAPVVDTPTVAPAPEAPTPEPVASFPTLDPTPAPEPTPDSAPVVDTPTVAPAPEAPTPEPVASFPTLDPTPAPEPTPDSAPVVDTPAPVAAAPIQINDFSAAADPSSDARGSKKVIQPLNDLSNPGANIMDLAAKEEAATNAAQTVVATAPSEEMSDQPTDASAAL